MNGPSVSGHLTVTSVVTVSAISAAASPVVRESRATVFSGRSGRVV